MCEVEGYYGLCYQRIPCLQGCLGGEVLHCCHNVHNHHDPMAMPFRVRQPSRNVHSFEVFEQRYRTENHKYGIVTHAVSWNESATVTTVLKYASPW